MFSVCLLRSNLCPPLPYSMTQKTPFPFSCWAVTPRGGRWEEAHAWCRRWGSSLSVVNFQNNNKTAFFFHHYTLAILNNVSNKRVVPVRTDCPYFPWLFGWVWLLNILPGDWRTGEGDWDIYSPGSAFAGLQLIGWILLMEIWISAKWLPPLAINTFPIICINKIRTMGGERAEFQDKGLRYLGRHGQG